MGAWQQTAKLLRSEGQREPIADPAVPASAGADRTPRKGALGRCQS